MWEQSKAAKACQGLSAFTPSCRAAAAARRALSRRRATDRWMLQPFCTTFVLAAGFLQDSLLFLTTGKKAKKKITFFPQLTVSHLDVFKNMKWLFIFLVWKNKYISSWDPTPWQTSACLCGVALPEGLDPPNKTPSLSLKLRLVSKTCQSECLLLMVLSVITACCCHYKVNAVQPVLPVKRKEKVLLLTDCIEEAGLSTWQRLPFHVQ